MSIYQRKVLYVLRLVMTIIHSLFSSHCSPTKLQNLNNSFMFYIRVRFKNCIFPKAFQNSGQKCYVCICSSIRDSCLIAYF